MNKIPILLYHQIADLPGNELALAPVKFKYQMDYLHRAGFTPISLGHLWNYYHQEVLLPAKPVIITFDDGYLNQYTYAFPILRMYNFTATFFIITRPVDQGEQGYMNWSQLRHMRNCGMSIESHTITHPNLEKLSPKEQTQEICGAKLIMERNLANPVEFFAFPYGAFQKITLVLTRRCGYKGAVAAMPGKVDLGEDLYTLKRITILGSLGLEAFAALLD